MAPIVLFDGDCALCHAAVRFVVRHDRQGVFRFASQESSVGRALLERHGIARERGRTLVLLEDGCAYVRSEAVLRIARRLRGVSSLVTVGRALPRPWRDAAYDWVARHRPRPGGAACPVVPPELRARFLDLGAAIEPLDPGPEHRYP